MFAQLKTQPTPLDCASPNTQAPSRETSVSNGHGTPLRFGAVGGSLGQCGGWTPTELCQAVRGLCMVQKKCAWKLFHDMILENYVINWHLLFLIAMAKLGTSPPKHFFGQPGQRPWNGQVLEVFRATTTDWKGPMSSIAMWRPSAFGIFTWRSIPGTIFGGVGLKGWLKGSDFKRLVSLMYIWYMIYLHYFFCWKTIDLCVKYSQMGDIAWSLREHNKR